MSQRPEEPPQVRTFTWNDKELRPGKDGCSVFLSSPYFPELFAIAVLDLQLKEKVIPKLWSDLYSLFRSGRVVGPKNKNGFVFCKHMAQPIKLKKVKAENHTRFFGEPKGYAVEKRPEVAADQGTPPHKCIVFEFNTMTKK